MPRGSTNVSMTLDKLTLAYYHWKPPAVEARLSSVLR
jgi:hypothetical protein